MNKRGTYHKYSKDEIDVLKIVYPDYSNKYLARFFGVTPDAIGALGRKLGLSKSDKLRKEACRKGAEKTNEIRWGHG